ncbi:MAG: hypothetical protein IJ636_07565 [Bacteroidales bacterium]|nr:hypothetical protein [Bacteroidales bacterium]
MIITAGLGLVLTSCGSKTGDPEFKYSIDEFADIEVLRYQVPGWEDLSFQQKSYIYHLSEAAKAGRDITWDQNFKYNLEIRHLLENILENYKGERKGDGWDGFLVYAKRVFFSNGIHHHYANDKGEGHCHHRIKLHKGCLTHHWCQLTDCFRFTWYS